MFTEEREAYKFQWSDIGDIKEGRPNLGNTTVLEVYRLLQFTLRDVLIKRYDPDTAADIYREAGNLAGTEFCKNVLNTDMEFNEFVADLQEKLKALNIGVLRIEKADMEKLHFVMTVAEDLDCSGLPAIDETVCDYDEGFIAGILNTYTGKKFNVKEIDCWASGGRVCRFDVKVQE
jgi:predicted hydrocarbon binding protein